MFEDFMKRNSLDFLENINIMKKDKFIHKRNHFEIEKIFYKKAMFV